MDTVAAAARETAAAMERALSPKVSPSTWSDSSQHKLITDVVLVLGAYIPVLLDIIPMIFLLLCRSLQRTVELFRAPAMLATAVNAAIWLLFTMVYVELSTTTEERSTELIISYPSVFIASYIYLLLLCFQKNWPLRGMLLTGFVLPFIGYIFYASRFGNKLVDQYENWIGFAGLLALVIMHALTISDIEKIEGFLGYFLMVLNIIPTGSLSIATYIVLLKQSKTSKFVLLSSEIGSWLFLLELLVLILHSRYRNHGGGNHGQNNDNDNQGAGAGGQQQNHGGNNGIDHQVGDGGGQLQNHGGNNDNDNQGAGAGAQMQNHGGDNQNEHGADDGDAQLDHGHLGFDQVGNQHEIAVVIQHDYPDGLNDHQIVAVLGSSGGESKGDSSLRFSLDDEKSASMGNAGHNAHLDGFGKVTTEDIPKKTERKMSANRTPDIQRSGVSVVSPPRGFCCGIPRHRRGFQAQHPVA